MVGWDEATVYKLKVKACTEIKVIGPYDMLNQSD
jgi:hypothetical protein